MVRSLILTGILLISTRTMALLPPYYQSVKEINAILADRVVSELIGSGRFIRAISKTEEGYIVEAGECTLQVIIHYLPPPQNFVGPANFEIKTDKLDCQKKSQ